MKRQQSCTPNTGNGGNYYNFWAASASGKIIDNIASDTICPKSWTIVGYVGNQSFVNLTTIYLRIDKNSVGLNTSIEEALRAAPLSFVRSGLYSYTTSTLLYRSDIGYFWSSRAYSATNAYYLAFERTGIYPQRNGNRGNGFALRCVAR